MLAVTPVIVYVPYALSGWRFARPFLGWEPSRWIGTALILVASDGNDGAIVAADRVLAQRPRDADALFVKGLALYRKADWKGAVDVWTIYLDVGQFHSASDMVRALYQDAKVKAGS